MNRDWRFGDEGDALDELRAASSSESDGDEQQRPTAPTLPGEDVADDDDDAETLFAVIPEELLAETAAPEDAGGLQHLLSREPGPAPPPVPNETDATEADAAMMEMLLEEAEPAEPDADATPVHPTPAAPFARKPPRLPPRPPMSAVHPDVGSPMPPPAAPPPRRRAADDTPTAQSSVAPAAASVASPEPDAAAGADEPVDASASFVEAEEEDLDEDATRPLNRPSRILPLPPPTAFPNEQDASAHLVRLTQRDAWSARAEWLRAEAQAIEDKAARARALVAISELYAMAGDEPAAKEVAAEARELAPSSPIAFRQHRGLLARDADWEAVLEVLDAETRVTATPAAKCHGSILGAQIMRLRLADTESARRRIEQAQRVNPADPRAHVERYCQALGDTDGGIAKVRVPDVPDLAPLRDAVPVVAALRGVPPKGAPLVGSAYETLLRARAALEAGDVTSAVSKLEGLYATSSVAAGAGWLSSALAASKKASRARAITALRIVSQGTHPSDARRALAGRAIEIGDAAAARSAFSDTEAASLTAADRIALTALTGGSRSDIGPWIEAAHGDAELAPLLAAAGAALSAISRPGDSSDRAQEVSLVGGLRARVGATLGRALAAACTAPTLGSDALHNAVHAYVDAVPDTGVGHALSLELHLDSGVKQEIAQAVSKWYGDRAHSDRDRALAGALLYELAGNVTEAIVDLDRARAADPTHEGAARARASHADTATAAMVLAVHGQAVEPGPRAALLLTEAAMRFLDAAGDAAGSDGSSGTSNEAEALLRRAAEIDPKLPFAIHLGERTGRGRSDLHAVIHWIQARREASADPIEQACDFVREALLIPNGDSPAPELLEQALRARPHDIGLRDLYEKISPELPQDRAEWRAQRAAEAGGSDAGRLALEAALEFERGGDFARAAALAQQAIAAGETRLAPLCAYRCALKGHGTGDLVDALLPRARETTDLVEKLEIYERLAELDELGRGDAGSGLLWRQTILEESPSHLPTLRHVTNALIAAGRDSEIEPTILETAKTLEGPEAVANAMISARLRLRLAGWDDTRVPVEIAYRHEPRGLWALRQTAAHARVRSEHALAVEADRQLMERTDRPNEVATLSLRAAQSAAVAGDLETARRLLEHAIALVPKHLFAHLELARLLEAGGDMAGAAAACEAAARSSASREESARNLYRAATLWFDKVQDHDRARQAFEAVAEIDPSYGDVFTRLQAIYIQSGARAELAALLEHRLNAVTDPDERVEMEVLRGRALADVGDAAAAKQALAAALDAHPDHIDALSAFANVCALEGDWTGAEQAWIRLARLASDTARQVEIYMRLGEVYDEHLPNFERAELAYQEILKREPSNERGRERLVGLYTRMGDLTRALEQHTILINNAETPEAKCLRTTELASIYEAGDDAKKAEATLLQARKSWPKDDVALGALAKFYQRTQQFPAANVLLDRALADARRALGTGRFEGYLFSTVATVAELRDRHDAARVARATVASLEGNEVQIEGAGYRAADPMLDEHLAPDVLTPAFRELLRKTGPMLDSAVPFDLASIRATPVPQSQWHIYDRIRELAAAYRLPSVEVHVSGALGAVCVAASAYPPTVVVGQTLAESPREDVRMFLVHRALKVIQANASAFARTAPIDLWPMLAAYLKALNPAWVPQGVDPGKLNEALSRVSRAKPANLEPQLSILAADIIGSIGNRAPTLKDAINGWGARSALLALGDPNVALTAIAWAGGHTNAPPPSGKERLTWVGRNAEARELIVFSISDAYADARAAVGLK